MSTVSGIRDTLNIETGRIKKDVEAKIALLDPEISPLMTAVSTMGREYIREGEGANAAVKVTGVPVMKRASTSSRFEWWEDQLVGVKTAVNNVAGITSSDTTIEVDDYTIFTAGDIVWNTRTNELLEVNGTPSSSPVTFRRGVGASAVGVAMNNDDELIIIGNVYPEGAASRESLTNLETNVYNYTQIIRTPVEITETLKNTDLYTEDEWKYQMKKAGVEHLKKMERAFWFGKREQSQNTVNNTAGKPKRTTGGILNHFLSTNVRVAPSTLTESDWNSFLELALQKGSTKKWAFCSPRALSVIASFASNKLQTKSDDRVYGVSIHEYISPHGTIKLVRQPMFAESVNTNGHVVVLDLGRFKYRYLQNRDVAFLDNRQENDEDSRKGEYLCEVGGQLMNESEMAVLKGVQG